MSDMNQAVLDLKFLAERLAGILELRDAITTYDDMVNKTESLKEAEAASRAAIEQAQADQLQVVLETEAIRVKGDQMLADARQAIEDMKVKAAMEAESKASAAQAAQTQAQADAQAVLDGLTQRIADAKNELSDAVTKRTEAENTLFQVRSALAGLKSQL